MAMTQPLLEKKVEKKKRVSTYMVEPDQCDHNGLTTAKAKQLMAQYGPNQLAEKERNKVWEFFKHFWGPMPGMIWTAILVEIIQRAWADMLILLTLQIVNGVLGWYEESKAGDAIAALKNSLTPECHVKRDGKWEVLKAKELVPGDIVKLALGGNVPADCSVIGDRIISVDQSALTGESMPVKMKKGDTPKMGSNIVAGEVEACVVATGGDTFFGKTAALINSVDEEGHFQKILWSITLFLLGVSLVLVSVIIAVMLVNGNGFLETIGVAVVLLVASIPIAMQVVCTSTMALGSNELAKQNAIVSRLAAIEEIAGMDMLCSDKTGTLTLNQMTLQDLLPEDGLQAKQLKLYALLGTQWQEKANDAIDTMLFKVRDDIEADLGRHDQLDYEPFDPSVKRTTSTVCPKGNERQKFRVTKGAMDVIAGICHNSVEIQPKIQGLVAEYAHRGIRCLAVAHMPAGSDQWCYAGTLTFIDPPRPDTKDVIHKAMALGVGVKMITGDNIAIAKETCRMLDMGCNVLASADIKGAGAKLGDLAEACDGFAGVYPEHKFEIVEALRKNNWITGMTGDGVNDAPALKRADIGIAVQGATDAARAAADIVLVSPGLSVIVEAISLARQIFQRMKNYVTYRIACTLQLLVFFFLSVLCVRPEDTLEPEYDEEGHNIIPRYFTLPVAALVLITILNDGTIISIAYDHVVPGPLPEKWNLKIVCTAAAVLGAVACVSSIMLLLLCMYSHSPDSIIRQLGGKKLSFEEIQCVMYLKISLSDFLTVFSARTQGFFFERKPGTLLFCAAMFATAVSTVLAAYWPFEEMKAISWKLCGYVWLYCLAWWFLQDIIKVVLYKGMILAGFNESVAGQAAKAEKLMIQSKVKVDLAQEELAIGPVGPSTFTSPAQVLARIEALEAELKALKGAVSTMSTK